jgi:diguanylate cyclase (GGDEF)-like protein
MMCRMDTSEIGAATERGANERDLRRLNDSLRDHARGIGALGRVMRALAAGDEARPVVCRAACELASAPVALLLEPAGRELVSTAMSGVDMAPFAIQPRPEISGRAFTARASCFVADARAHPALAEPLVDATAARSALFEPALRDAQVCGVLIVIWRVTTASVPDATAGMLRLLAGQAAVAIEQSALRARMETLALTDPVSGVATRRVFEEELPRELARARRDEHPVSVALLELDDPESLRLQHGDRLIKYAAALWRSELREVDVLARLDDGRFAVVLPNCGLGEAVEVIDRLRAVTPRGETASAGAARWDGEEPPELLQARCDDALAAAKAAGGDVTIVAD